MSKKQIEWWESLKRLEMSARKIDWTAHLAQLNRQYGLSGNDEFSCSIPGWPPAWFTGNIEALQPGRWVLIVSINPAAPSPDHYKDYLDKDPWSFWTEHNRDSKHWNQTTKFFPRLAELARYALSLDSSKFSDEDVASDHMLFLEFCPYASAQFKNWKWDTPGGAQELVNSDIGFAINRQFRHISLFHGEPKLALLQGIQAAHDVKDCNAPNLIQVEAVKNPPYRVWRGTFRGFKHQTPLIGFPLLNSRSKLELEPRLDVIRAEIARTLVI